MKVEAWVFGICTIFLMLVSPAYWFITKAGATGADWTGTSVLTLTALLTTMMTAYLGFHATRMEPRPEDLKDADIADGAGELGFFPPYSWWPLWCASAAALGVFAIALGAWWLVIMASMALALAVSGWVFEYYRGEHAH